MCATKLAIYLMYREKKTCDDIMPNPFQNNLLERTLHRRRHDDCHHNTHSSLIEGGRRFRYKFCQQRQGLHGAMTKRICFSRQDSHMMFATMDTQKANIIWMLSASVLCDFGDIRGDQDFPKSTQIWTKKLISFEQLLR